MTNEQENTGWQELYDEAIKQGKRLLELIDAKDKELAEVRKQLKEESDQHKCWHFNAQELQKGYNELDRDNAELRKQLEARSSAVPGWQPLTDYGQAKVGDRLMFDLCGSSMKRTIGEVLNAGTDKEELIYDRGRNYYIITSMALKSEGNHKNVRYLSAAPKGE